MPEEKDKIKLMYDAMSPSLGIGSQQEFEQILKDKTQRNLFYQKASQSFELGGENDFNNLVDNELKKKSSGTSSSTSSPSVGPLQSGLRSHQANLWPQYDIEPEQPKSGPLATGFKPVAGIPWQQIDIKAEQGVPPSFTPQQVQSFDPEKFKVKVQEGQPDAIDPNAKLGDKINKDLEKTTQIMNTYKSAIGNLESKIDADIKSRDALASELKELKVGIDQLGVPKNQQEAMAMQEMYDVFNSKVEQLNAIQQSAEKKFATYQTVSKGYENRVKEMDPLMRTLSEDESEWAPYWDKVGAPMLGAFASAVPNQILRNIAQVQDALFPFWNSVTGSTTLNTMNTLINDKGLGRLDEFAKQRLLDSEKNAMKLRIREGTNLETLFSGDVESIKKNAGKIVDLAFKQAVASAPITVAALGATAFGGIGAGIAATYLGASGAKYASLKDRTDMSEEDKMASAGAEGAFEAMFEFLPDVINAKVVLNAVKGLGKKAAAKQVSKSMTDSFFEAYGKFFPITAPLGEGIGEVFTGIGQRYSDTVYDPQYSNMGEEKKNEYIFGKNFSKLKSEFAGGAAGATFFVAPQLIAETVKGIRDPKNRQIVRDLFTKKQAVEKDLAEGKLTGVSAEVAADEISNINGQISEVVKQNTEEGESITIDQKGAAEQINEQIDAITETLTTNTEISPETVAALEIKKDDLVKQVKEITTKVNLLEDLKKQEDATEQGGLEADKPTEVVGQKAEEPGSSAESTGEDKGSASQVEEQYYAKSGNKVVDTKGEPLVVYNNTHSSELVESKGVKGAYFFTPDEKGYEDYGDYKHKSVINLKNPKYIGSQIMKTAEDIKKWKAEGYDGLIYHRQYEEKLNGENNAKDLDLKYAHEIISFDKSNVKVLETTAKSQSTEPLKATETKDETNIQGNNGKAPQSKGTGEARQDGGEVKGKEERREVKEQTEKPVFGLKSDNPMQQGRIVPVLEKQIRADGNVMPLHKWIENMPSGLEVGTTKIGSSKSATGTVNKMVIGNNIVETKAEQDYYEYLQNGGESYSDFLSKKSEYEKGVAKVKADEKADYEKKRKEQQVGVEQRKNAQIKNYIENPNSIEESIAERTKGFNAEIEKLQKRPTANKAEIDRIKMYVDQTVRQVNKDFEIANALYEVKYGEVQPKYKWKIEDSVLVESQEGEKGKIPTKIEAIRENPDGTITYKVEKKEGIVNPYIGYDSIYPSGVTKAQEDIKKIVEATGAPKDNVIVTGIKPVKPMYVAEKFNNEWAVRNTKTDAIVFRGKKAEAEAFAADMEAGNNKPQSPKESKLKEKIKAIENKELDDLWDDFNKSTTTNTGLNPEQLAKAMKLTAKYIELGILKFADIVADAYARFGAERLTEIFPGLKQAYGAYLMTDEADSIEGLSEPKEVKTFDLTNFIDKQNEQDNSAVPNGDGRNPSELDGGKPATGAIEEVQGQQPEGLLEPEGQPSGGSDGANGEGGKVRSGSTGSSKPNNPSTGGTGRKRASSTSGKATGTDKGVSRNINNFRISENDTIVPKGEMDKIKSNVAAIKLAKFIQSENRLATDQEKKVLSKFVGWGGLATVLDESKFGSYYEQAWNEKYGKLHEEIKQILTPEEFQNAVNSTINAHYTERSVIEAMWSLAERFGFKGGNILEPGAGVGHFIGLMPQNISDNSFVTAYELDSLTGLILSKLYPDAATRITGYENSVEANNSQDLIIANVPFGKTAPYDKNNQDLSKFNLHNYFIAKGIRQLKPGGIGMFITSSSSMDNAGNGIKFREWTQNEGNADFIGAIRLPNNAFDKNAGTQVTTDIMIYRKRATAQASELNQPYRYVLPLREATNSEGKSTTIDINEYYINNPEMMLGEMFLASESGKGGLYNADAQTLMAPAGQKTIELLNERIKLFPENIFGAEASTRQAETEIAQATDKEGTLINKDGKLFLVENGSLVTPDWNYQDYKGINPETGGTKTYKKGEVAKNYLEIKEAVRELISLEQQKDVQEDLLEEKRAILNARYDKFVNRFGPFSRNRKIEFLEDDAEHNAVFALEDVKKTISFTPEGKVDRTYTIEKSPIFFKRVNFPVEEPATAENISDAVNISISYRNKIDVPFISGLVRLTEDEVIKELLSSGEAFENPDTGLLEDSNEYLSGFVRTKLKQAIAAAETNPLYNSNVKALEEVVPKDIPAQLIEFRLGSTWLPPSFVKDFIKETTGVSASVSYSDLSGRWTVGNESNSGDPRNKVTYGTNDFTAVELIEKALNLTQPTVSYTVKNPDGSKSTVKDVERTLEAQGKMQELTDMFYNYIKSDKDKMVEIERVYNNVYRDFIEKKYTLPSFVYYPGASRDIKLNAHQRKGVVRATRDSVLLAHEVGTGKTFTIITTAMEWRRLGIAKKPMIVVQNATLEQFARDFKKLYPSANILAPTKKEMDAKNRQMLFNKIAYGDWDSVIIPQSFLDFIPDDEARERAYLQEQIDEVQEALDDAIDSDDRGAVSELRRIAKSLDEKMDEVGKPKKRKVKDKAKANLSTEKVFMRQADRRKDDVLNFEQMGIDALVVDEAHNYKKLGFVSKMSRIKGIDVGRSKRAFGLFMKVRWIQEKNNGRNIVFATGTPITNTMAEAWTMMKFVAPEIVEKYNISSFDQFASTFGVVEPSLEFGPTGKFKMVERFKSYMNAPELLTAFRSKTDVVLTEDIPEFKESNSIPKLKIQEDGKPGFTTVYLDQTEQLKTTMGVFKQTLEDWEKMTGKEKRALSYLPLLIFNRAKQAAIDLRLIDPPALDDPGSKTNAVVKEAKRIYDATSDYKGTQLIFSDMYQSPEAKEKFLDEEGTIPNPAYGLPRFNLYNEIKSKLVAQGIPENEIVVINDYEGDKRQFIFNQVKEGNVRILLGSTERMGVGVNVQDKLAAIHHIDAPPRPMDFAQRNGRILRQGNTHAEMGLPVEILTYGVKKTLDATAYQRLEFKQKFINQMMKAEGVDRVMADEADEDNPSDMAFSQMMSTLSGSQYAVLHTQRMYELRKLRTAKSNYERRLVELNDTVKNNYKIIDSLKAQKDNYIPFIDNIIKYFPDGKVTNVTVNEVTVSENMGDAVEVLVEKVKTKLKTTKAGTSIQEEFEANGKTIVIHGTLYVGMNGIPTPYVTYSMGTDGSNFQFQGEINTGVGLMMSLNRKIKEATDKEMVSEAIASFDKRIARANETIEVSKDLLTKPFDKEAELAKKEAEVIDLEEKMKNESSEEEVKEGGGPDDSGPKPKGLADRGIDYLERMKFDTKNNMFGMLPPFALAIPLWNGTVSLMQTAIRLGKMTHEVINEGLDYIRSQGVAFAHEQDFIDYFTSVLDGPPDQPPYTPQDVEDARNAAAQDIKEKYKDIEKAIFGSATSEEQDMANMTRTASKYLGLVNRLQDKTGGQFKQYLGDGLANAYARKVVSDSKLVRNAATALNSLFANLGKTNAQQLEGESFVGRVEKGISDANQISKWLRHAIENSPVSLLRIDQVLDPEFYNKMSLERFKSYLKDEIGEEDYNNIPEEQMADWYAQYLLDIGYNENYKPTTLEDLNPAELEVYTMLRNINNFLHDLNFVNGKMPYSTYIKNKGKYVARLYSIYELPQDANDLVNNNNREYMNPYKKRGEITEWKVNNRLSDPIYATTKRLYQTFANDAIYQYADFVMKQPGQVSRTPMPGFTLMGQGYGKLTGKYLRNDIAEDFKGFFFAQEQLNQIYDALKSFDRWAPRQFYKKLFTVYNPGVHLGNLTSNYVFAYLSGINGARLSSNVWKAYKEIRDYGPMYRYLLSKGVLKSSLSRTDLANSITTLDKLTNDATESQNVWSKMAEIPGDIYAGVDDVYKIAAYVSLLEEGMSPAKAVDRVMEGFQNYKRVGKTYDFTSKIPLVGKPFGKFAGDMLRIVKNAGMTRPLQAATFIATLHGIAYLASKMSGEDDRERRIRASRPGFAKIPMPEMLGGDIELGWKVGDNEFNAARLITPLFIYSGVDDGDAYDAWQKFSPLPIQIDNWTQHPNGTGTVNIAKNFGSDPILSPVLQLWLNADFRGVPILDPDETKYKKSTLPEISITKLQGKERLTNAVGFLLRSYGGAYYSLADDLRASLQGKPDHYKREKTPVQVISRFLGVKVEQFPDTKYGKIMESKAKSFYYRMQDQEKIKNQIYELYGQGKIDLETAQMRMVPVLEENARIVKEMEIEFGSK